MNDERRRVRVLCQDVHFMMDEGRDTEAIDLAVLLVRRAEREAVVEELRDLLSSDWRSGEEWNITVRNRIAQLESEGRDG